MRKISFWSDPINLLQKKKISSGIFEIKYKNSASFKHKLNNAQKGENNEPLTEEDKFQIMGADHHFGIVTKLTDKKISLQAITHSSITKNGKNLYEKISNKDLNGQNKNQLISKLKIVMDSDNILVDDLDTKRKQNAKNYIMPAVNQFEKDNPEKFILVNVEDSKKDPVINKEENGVLGAPSLLNKKEISGTAEDTPFVESELAKNTTKHMQSAKKDNLISSKILIDNKQTEEILLKIKGAAISNTDLLDLTKKDK
jgi:hypothetical protein